MRRTRARRRRKGISIKTFRLTLAFALLLLCAYAAIATRAARPMDEATPESGEKAEAEAEKEAAFGAFFADSIDAQSEGIFADSDGSRAEADIHAGGFCLYALQFGAFAERENALALSRDIALQGAGGYVYDDGGLFRVLGAAYSTSDEAQSVKRRLEAENGVSTSLFEIAPPSVSLRVTAEKPRLAAVQSAFSLLDSACADLTALALSFDSGEKTLEQAVSELSALSDELAACQASLAGAKGEIQPLLFALDSCAGLIDNCAAAASKAAFASAIRTCQLEFVFAVDALLRSAAK